LIAYETDIQRKKPLSPNSHSCQCVHQTSRRVQLKHGTEVKKKNYTF